MNRHLSARIDRLCALLILALLFHSTAITAQGKLYQDVTTVVVVEVPIHVLVDGEPVRGLTAENFEILERKKKLRVVGFDVIDLGVGETESRPLAAMEIPSAGRRHFLLLFDLSFSDPGAIVKARTAAKELVLEGLHPSDVVAVATYSAAKGARLVLSFTSDRRQIDYALDTLGLINPTQAVRDPLGIVLADLDSFAGLGFGENPADQSGPAGLDPAAELLDLLSSTERKTRRQVQENEILALSSSLAEIAQMMNSVEGRKHVVFLSEGFDSSILLGTEDIERIQEINQASEFGEVWNVDSDERFGSTSTLGELLDMLDQFRRTDCVIQSVDIGGLRAGADLRPRAPGQDGLFLMANQTGGEFYRNYNDLSEAMQEMLERTSVTYVVAVQPKDLKIDGKFRRLKVRLKDGPLGARLVHRPGYYAPRPYSEQTAMERRLGAADLIVGGSEGGQISLSILVTPFEVSRSKAYVPVLIEIDGPSLLRGAQGDVLPAEIYAYAIDSQGSVRDFFTRSLGFDLKKAGAALERSGFKFWGDFELPPGDYLARVMVRNGQSGASGLRTQAIKVPAMDQAESMLLPPLFPEPQGKWLLAKEENSTDQQGVPYPFMLRGRPFIPAAKPVIRSGQEAEICLVGYNLGEGTLHVAGQVLARDGTPVQEAELLVDERPYTGDPVVDRMVARLRTGKLAAGEYKLVVTVTDATTGQAQTSSIPVVVEE